MRAPLPTESSDEELMLGYAAGDAAAFAQLFARHERAVYRFLLRSSGGQPALADDLLQEVWLAVVRGARTYEPRARFTTWLFGIARSRLIDHWRARRDHASLDDPGEAAAGDDGDARGWIEQLPASRADQPEIRALSRAHANAMVSAVEALPAPQREAFLLHAEGGLSLEEIAALTGAGVETTKSRLRYALRKLREAMEEWR